MKKYVLAIALASGSLYGLTAQAAPLPGAGGVQTQISSSAEQVWHCRAWSGGWGCGGWGHNRFWSHRRWGSYGGWHSRYWSHRRHGSWGW
jgi:hypothetical protein